jgi:glycosidase
MTKSIESALIFTCLLILFNTNLFAQSNAQTWLKQTNIYEINTRQFSSEGNFSGVIKQLPRLKEMGVEIICLLPVTPIGLDGRKMNENELGSCYAVKHYNEINPEFGNLDDFKKLITESQALGLKVVIDWVANQTARDHDWVAYHPNFYEHQSNGDFVSPNDMTDVFKLNFEEAEMRDSMIQCMITWVRQFNIDGFRCVFADPVPADFWAKAIGELKLVKKNLLFLADGEKTWFHEVGFDATYASDAMHKMVNLASGKMTIDEWEEWLFDHEKEFPKDALRIIFTSNHDANTQAGIEFDRFGKAALNLAVFGQTFPGGVPMLFNGQEIPLKRRLAMYVKDSITWMGFENSNFYKKLHHIRRTSPALASDASYKRVKLNQPELPVWAYLREKDGHRILVLLNFSEREQKIQLRDETAMGKATEIFSQSKILLKSNNELTIPEWGYQFYQFSKN